MAKTMAVIQGLGQKMSRKEHQECRILQLDLPSPCPVDIEFTNLTLTISQGLRARNKKTILKDVSGLFKSGELTAIMGPSGAGKSSLMNALTGFALGGVTGRIRAGDCVTDLTTTNSSFQTLKSCRKKSCYILQDDRLDPLFTVSELMKFAADMKLGNSLTDKLKLGVVNEIMATLGLSGCANTKCDNLSGGQKKRLSIAVELIDNPPVLFLDEPTTGLDSRTTAQCMEMLKDLARNGRTIVCTIHQPPASIYSMFDQVYILAEGMCIYQGSSENTVPYLASIGLQCPMYHNPADYILEIATGEYGKFNDLLAEKASKTWQEWQVTPLPLVPLVSAKNDTFPCGKTSIIVNKPHELYKFGILFKRSVLQLYRDWTVTQLRVFLHMMIGILLGLLYQRCGSDGSKVVSNLSFLLVSTVYLCYTSIMPAVLKSVLFQNCGSDASKTVSNLSFLLGSTLYLCYTSIMPALLKIPLEMSVLKKENFNNWYNLKTYYAALLVTGMPMQIVYSFVYSLPSYFLSDQPAEFFRFVMFVLTLSNVALLAEAVGHVIGTCVNPVNGTFLGAICTCAMIVYAGFIVLLEHMSPVMRVVSYGSFLRHAFEALTLSQYAYDRQPLVCPPSKEYCHLRYPKTVLEQFSFHPDNFWIDILILVCEIVAVRILNYFTLRRSIKRCS